MVTIVVAVVPVQPPDQLLKT
jgi:hypothetical protein